LKFPYDKPRLGQLEASERVYEAVRRGSAAVLAAPTGFGKTAVALYSAGRLLEEGYAERIIYAVRTRNELDVVIRDARASGMKFTVLFSAKRMCPFVRREDVSVESFWTVCSVLRLRGICAYYSRLSRLSEDDIIEVAQQAPDHAAAPKLIADKLGVCPYFASLMLAQRAQITALTYPYIFKTRIRKVLEGVDFSKSILIVDEAHNLTNIGGIVGDSIPVEAVSKAIEEVKKFFGGAAVDEVKFLEELSRVKPRLDRGYSYIGKYSVGFDRDVAESIASIAADIAMEVVSKFEGLEEEALNVELKVYSVAKFLETLSDERFDLFVSASPQGRVELHALPVDFGVVGEVLEAFRGVIFVSATPPSEEFLRSVAGLKRGVEYVDAADFGARDYLRENTAAVIFTGATTAYRERGEDVYRTYAQLIESIYKSAGEGVTLIVYPSYEVMWEVVKRLPRLDSFFVESGEPLSKYVELSKTLKRVFINAVAGGRLTEGIEIVDRGESLIKYIVVVGVPYPQPDDYTEHLRNRLGSSYRSFMDELAAMRVLQAVGRSVRSENDYALVLLADRRFAEPRLAKRLKLRFRAVTSSIRIVSDIVRDFATQMNGTA